MNAFRVEEDMPIESGMLTRSRRSEEGGDVLLRRPKQVFEYDEVMNNQRRAVFDGVGCWMAAP